MLGGVGCSDLDPGQVVGGPAVAGDEGRGLRELGRRVALLEEQARQREEELAGAGRWTAKTRGGHRT